jgi:hypothetical protein
MDVVEDLRDWYGDSFMSDEDFNEFANAAAEGKAEALIKSINEKYGDQTW